MSADDHKTPRGLRLGDRDDRDKYPRKTPPKGISDQLAAPHEVPEETTGVIRRRQLDSIQIELGKLSKGHETLGKEIVDVKVSQAHTLGKLGLLDVLMTRMSSQDRTLDAIYRKRAVTDIGDEADARKQGRTLRNKIIGAMLAAVTSTVFLTWLFAKACR